MTRHTSDQVRGVTTWAPPLRVFLLGGFRVAQGDREIGGADWPRRKAKNLFKVLLLRPGYRLPRDQALDLFWPDLDQKSASNNLYRIVHLIRRVLEPDLADAATSAYLALENEIVSLKPGSIAMVDVAEFERLARLGKEHGQVADLDTAAGLYAGDLLPDDIYEEWTIRRREELQLTYLDVMLRLATAHEQLGEHDRAIDVLRQLLSVAPSHEEAHRDLMRVYAQSGQRHLAIRQFQLCRDALRRELDVEVERATIDLHDQIQSGAMIATRVSPAANARAALLPPRDEPASPGQGARQPRDRPKAGLVARSSALIGRERELAELRPLLDDALAGERRLILLSGEAGVGKSALAAAIMSRAADRGAITLAGAAYELEGALPFGPIVDALREYFRQLPDLQIRQSIAAAGNGIGRLLPEVASNSEQAESPNLAESAQDRLVIFEAVNRFICTLAESAPLALWLDDIHAADEATLQLLHYLARRTESLPLFLLVTFREEAADDQTLRRFVAELYREKISARLRLGRLDAAASHRLTRSILGGEIADDLSAAIYQIAVGNPFYTVELTRHLRETGRVEWATIDSGGRWQLIGESDVGVPPELGDLIRHRLERLGDDAATVLGLAAVIGQEFDQAVLSAASGLDDERVLDVLDRALLAHLIEEIDTRYRFVHPLTREALYGELTWPRRVRLHSAVAAALEQLPAHTRDDTIEVIAHHYSQAGLADRAAPYSIRAGDRAARVYANDVAIAYYRQAVRQLEARSPVDGRRAEVLEKLGDVHRLAGDADAALAAYEAATKDPASASASALRLHRKAAYSAILAGQLEAADRHLGLAFDCASSGGDSAELARLHYVAAQLDWHREQFRAAFASARQSLQFAERLDNPAETAQAYEMMALACHSLGEWQQGIEYEIQRQSLRGPTIDAAEAFDAHL
jgi:DNA-binding SARP family transcriptional activator